MEEKMRHSRHQARASYNRMSRLYDLLTFSEDRLRELGLQKLGVKKGELFLEIGCGTGRTLTSLSGRAYGIDISDRMCRLAYGKLRNKALSNTGVICGDAARLPFSDAAFDCIFLCFTLELFDDPDAHGVLRECYRALRGSGRMCVVAMAKEEKTGLMSRLYGRAHDAFPNYIDCRPIVAAEMLMDAGFKNVDVTKASAFGLPVEIVTASKNL